MVGTRCFDVPLFRTNRRSLQSAAMSRSADADDHSATLENQPLDSNTASFIAEAAASPFDFHTLSVKAAGDEKLKRSINNAVLRQYTARQLRLLELPDSDRLRSLAGQIKQHAIENLDFYLEQLIENVHHNGGHVHLAADGAEARKIIL